MAQGTIPKESRVHDWCQPSSNLHPAGFKHGFQGSSTCCPISLGPSRMRFSQWSCQHPRTRREWPSWFWRFSHFHSRSISLEHNYCAVQKESFQAHSHHLTCSKELQQRARAQSNCNNPRRQSQRLAVHCEGSLGSCDNVFRSPQQHQDCNFLWQSTLAMNHFKVNSGNKHKSRRSSSHQQCISHQATHQCNLSPKQGSDGIKQSLP